MNKVGAFPRDSMNRRTIGDVRNSTGVLYQIGDPNILTGPAAPADADSDGIPDFWEDAMGLNKTDPKDALQDKDGDGYTNVEEYLNDLALARLCRDYSNPVYPIPSDWPDYNPSCCKYVNKVEAGKSGSTAAGAALSIAPNPFTSFVKITSIGAAWKKAEFKVFDINAKLVDARSGLSGNSITWTPNRLPAGVYYLRFQADGQRYSEKFVIR
jgi:hypothetical protein